MSFLIPNADEELDSNPDLELLMDVEYKIVQANTPLFSNTEKMNAILAEEAPAGWQLVEKMDNYKLRLRRDISARDNDSNLSFDPYRCQVGVNSVITYGATAIGTIGLVYLIFMALGTFQ